MIWALSLANSSFASVVRSFGSPSVADGTTSPSDIERPLAEQIAGTHGIQSEDLLKGLAARLSTIREIASVTVARSDSPRSGEATISPSTSFPETSSPRPERR